MRNKQATKENIINNAIRLFTKKGFVKVSTLEIAQKSQVAHGTIFFHFPKRSEIIIASIFTVLNKLAQSLNEKSRHSQDVRQLCEIFLDEIEKNRKFYTQLVKDMPHLPIDVQRMVFASFSAFSIHFVETIESVQRISKARKFKPKYAMFFWFGVVNYVYTYSKFLGTENLTKEDREEIINFFLASIFNNKF